MNNNSLYDLLNNNTIRIAFIGVLAILALFLLAQTITLAANFGRSGAPATDTVTVQGMGEVNLPPDVARVTFTVMHTAATVAQAQEETNTQTKAVVEYVKGQDIEEKDIKTLYYNISPQYSYPNPCPPNSVCPAYSGTPKITGYEVSETIQVTIRDLDKAATLVGGIGQLGVQNLNGPSFALDDPTAGYNAARADAINKAKAQAKVLADQLGVRLGKIISFSESGGGYYPPMYAERAYGMGGGADQKAVANPTLQPGENAYSAQVTITYEIR
jgi:uncharacterized protein